MKKILLLIILSGLSKLTMAQQARDISGTVKDTTGLSVIAASVQLISATDTLRTSTNAEGVFIFRNVKSSRFTIAVRSIGYQSFTRQYRYNNTEPKVVIDPITLKIASNALDEDVISGTPAVTIKEDTVE